MTGSRESAGGARIRPAPVPEGAIFVGGADGGVYLVCRPHERLPHRFRCTVYDDFYGDVEEDGVFALEPSGGFDPADPKAYGAWALGSIFLRDGRVLEAVPDEGVKGS